MNLARRLALRPSRQQKILLAQHAGCARKAWNWGLRRKREERAKGNKVPTAVDLHRELNILKKISIDDGGFPYMYGSSKCAPQEALRDLDNAFKHFFRRCKEGAAQKGHPRFHGKRPGEGHFRVTGAIKLAENTITLPRIGSIRIQPGCRGYAPAGCYTSASVVQEHGEWFVSVLEEVVEAPPVDLDTAPRIGLDVGVRKLATLSDGEMISNPKALASETKCLQRREAVVKRKQRARDKRLGPIKKGERRPSSNRLKRARRIFGKAQRRVKNLRRDAIHKTTHDIAKRHPVVVIEDLQVQNMTRRCKGKGRAAKARLNRAILDASFHEFQRQLDYKLKLRGGHLLTVPAPYTSQDCSRCGARNDPGDSEVYYCASCGLVIDRDVNAAKNIVAASWTDTQNARGGGVRPGGPRAVRQLPMRREQDWSPQCPTRF